MSATEFTVGSDGYPHIDKDPDAIINYAWDWTPWMARAGSSTISTATVTPAAGLTLVGGVATISGNKIYATLSGGTAGTSYSVTCRINTNDGLRDERTIVVDVKEQ